MARQINRLNAQSCRRETRPGRHADGGGLYLVIDSNGAKRWAFLFRQQGRLREMGLGGLNAVPLAKARELAAGCRATVAAGRDPIADRKSKTSAVPTFGVAADAFVEAMGANWHNAKHRAQWKTTLAEYAAPLRPKLVDAITTEDVLAVLKPIWLTKSQTASRVRGRIEAVLDAARAAGHRSGENPARWKGHLKQILPKPRKLARGHHTAMPYKDLPAFIGRLRECPDIAALALELLVLTAARSGEVRGARWSEIDRQAKLWTVPAERMKAQRDHRVPLPDRACEILDEAEKLRTGDFIFPGRGPNRPRSGTVFEMMLRRLEVGVTPHGFRSAFRDWAGNETTFPREVAEAALAHAVGDETELAYRRGDALKKRRKLMEAWARYCEPKAAGNVLELRKAVG